jgi:hypothetical protein
MTGAVASDQFLQTEHSAKKWSFARYSPSPTYVGGVTFHSQVSKSRWDLAEAVRVTSHTGHYNLGKDEIEET